MDQSKRYADLQLREADLVAGGRHVLCAYSMKPKAGYEYLATAAHFAAESSTGTNVEVSTTDDFTRSVDALVYEVNEAAGAISEAADDDANIIFGAVVDERLEGKISITVVATGFGEGAVHLEVVAPAGEFHAVVAHGFDFGGEFGE